MKTVESMVDARDHGAVTNLDHGDGALPPVSRDALPGGVAPITRRRLTGLVGFEWLSRALGLAMGLAVVGLLTRHLGPARFGDFSLALALVTVAHVCGEFGFKQSVIRQASIDGRARDVIAGTYVLIRGIVGVVLFAVVLGVGFVLARDEIARLGMLGMALPLTFALISSSGVVLQIRMRTELFASLIMFQSTLWLGVVLLATVLGWNLVGLAFGYAAVWAVQTVATFVLARRLVRFRIRYDRRWAGQLVRYALPLTLAGLFAGASAKVDSIVVYTTLDARVAGLYSAAYRILEQLQVVPVAMTGLVAPLLATWYATGDDRFQRAVQKLAQYVTVVAIPVAAGLALASTQLSVFLYGSEFRGVGGYLMILAPAFVFTGVTSVYMVAAIAAGRVVSYTAIAGTALGLKLALCLVFVPRFGADGAAVITFAIEGMTAVALHWDLHKSTGVSMKIRHLGRVATASAPAAGVVVALWHAPVLAMLAAAGLTYAVACHMTRAFAWNDVKQLVARDVVARV